MISISIIHISESESQGTLIVYFAQDDYEQNLIITGIRIGTSNHQMTFHTHRKQYSVGQSSSWEVKME